MREDLSTHVVFHLRAHDVTDIRDVVIRKELDHHESDKNKAEMYYPLLRALLEIDDLRRYIADNERHDECNG